VIFRYISKDAPGLTDVTRSRCPDPEEGKTLGAQGLAGCLRTDAW